MSYDNTNRGALFKNTDKNSESAPDYKGNINANGEEMWLSAWIRKSKEGKTYMSLAALPKEERKPAKKDRGTPEYMDSDVPF